MRVNVASRVSPGPLPHHHHHSYKPNSPPSPVASIPRRRRGRSIRRSESDIFGASLKLTRPSQYLLPPLRRTVSASYYGESSNLDRGGDEFAHQIEEFTRQAAAADEVTVSRNNQPIAPPSNVPTTAPFCPSKLDLLEPSLLGIRPEPPDWPAREEVIRDSIARRANCVELPLSLRMIKKKKQHLQRQQRFHEGGEGGFRDGEVEISRAFSSTVSMIGELQSQALRLRGLALNEDFESIVGKVQLEMNSSFVWLFREVFSRTPDLMVDVMLLTVDFASDSIQKNCSQAMACEESPPVGSMVSEKRKTDKEESRNLEEKGIKINGSSPQLQEVMVEEEDEEEEGGGRISNAGELLGGLAQMIRYPTVTEYGESELNEVEAMLWNSIVEEASEMQGEVVKEEVDRAGDALWLDHGTMEPFVSPVSVEIEKDDYAEFYRTDLHYQAQISQEPNNPLLLSNYARFLYLVARDYDRAEECFKRAIQLDATDPEVLSHYATFLWVIRKDLWGAEERYQQAATAEPSNPFHASKYASFLWSTGGEDTCYPLDVSPNKS